MKIYRAILVILLIACITGCKEKNTYQVSGQYMLQSETANSVYLPKLEFNEQDNTFMIDHDVLSSTMIGGTFKVKDSTVYAEAYIGEMYLFDIVDENTLVFSQKNSSKIDLKNGEIGLLIEEKAVFKKVES